MNLSRCRRESSGVFMFTILVWLCWYMHFFQPHARHILSSSLWFKTRSPDRDDIVAAFKMPVCIPYQYDCIPGTIKKGSDLTKRKLGRPTSRPTINRQTFFFCWAYVGRWTCWVCSLLLLLPNHINKLRTQNSCFTCTVDLFDSDSFSMDRVANQEARFCETLFSVWFTCVFGRVFAWGGGAIQFQFSWKINGENRLDRHAGCAFRCH